MQRELEASSAGDKVSAWKEYKSLASGQSNAGARIAAHKVLGKHIFWDWDRTYHIIVSPPHLMSLDSSEDERRILSHHGRIRGSSAATPSHVLSPSQMCFRSRLSSDYWPVRHMPISSGSKRIRLAWRQQRG